LWELGTAPIHSVDTFLILVSSFCRYQLFSSRALVSTQLLVLKTSIRVDGNSNVHVVMKRRAPQSSALSHIALWPFTPYVVYKMGYSLKLRTKRVPTMFQNAPIARSIGKSSFILCPRLEVVTSWPSHVPATQPSVAGGGGGHRVRLLFLRAAARHHASVRRL
jgi:hypothetical protein